MFQNRNSWFQFMIFPITSFMASPRTHERQVVGAPYSDEISLSLVVLVASCSYYFCDTIGRGADGRTTFRPDISVVLGKAR